MKKLSFLLFVVGLLSFSSCEVCYECTWVDEAGMEYTEERCDTKDRMNDFVEKNKELGWECKKK